MERECLGGSGVKPESGNIRLFKVALAMCVCVCAALLLALILGKSNTHDIAHIFFPSFLNLHCNLQRNLVVNVS